MKQLSGRIKSIDVFRAITMFLMIFVNDVDGVEKIPGWIKHVGDHSDGLGFADTIFPAFLFIVGLSIPFAIKNRISKGESQRSLVIYIATRSFALIVMGFFHVNMESYSKTSMLPEPVFEIFVTIAFFLIWLDYSPSINKIKRYSFQIAGVIILIIMAFLFKGVTRHGDIVGMRPYWWGILGLIGWSYFTCSYIFLFSKGKFFVQATALLLFLFFNVATHAEWLTVKPVEKYLWIIGGHGAMPALTMAGVVTSLLYSNFINKGKQKLTWIILPLIGIAMIIFGFITRPYGGISKNHDTPSWVGICTGISILVFTLLIFLVDIKGKAKWFDIIKPAGTSTLTCYLIPYILYSLYEICHFEFPDFLNEGIGGILRSFATAFIVIFIVYFLEKKRIRLKV